MVADQTMSGRQRVWAQAPELCFFPRCRLHSFTLSFGGGAYICRVNECPIHITAAALPRAPPPDRRHSAGQEKLSALPRLRCRQGGSARCWRLKGPQHQPHHVLERLQQA